MSVSMLIDSFQSPLYIIKQIYYAMLITLSLIILGYSLGGETQGCGLETEGYQREAAQYRKLPADALNNH